MVCMTLTLKVIGSFSEMTQLRQSSDLNCCPQLALYLLLSSSNPGIPIGLPRCSTTSFIISTPISDSSKASQTFAMRSLQTSSSPGTTASVCRKWSAGL